MTRRDFHAFFVVVNVMACATLSTASWFGGALSVSRPVSIVSAVAFAVAAVASLAVTCCRRHAAALAAGTATIVACLARAAANAMDTPDAWTAPGTAGYVLRITAWLWLTWLLWLAWASWLVPTLLAEGGGRGA